MSFPAVRMRRLRSSRGMRHWLQEHRLHSTDLVYPIFVKESLRGKRAIASMPGQYQHGTASAVREAASARDLGIPAVLLFGIPQTKDTQGSAAFAETGGLQKTVRTLKKRFRDLIVITDVCLCEYTSHGHCGLLHGQTIDNDRTLEVLAKTALSHARAGADVVAPSDMMDGRVGAIRQSLDRHGFQDIPILSYAVKYASAFYGPFRHAAENKPAFGDRATYQMNPANAREALSEVALDIQEGADLVLVKPMMAYLDIVKAVRENFRVPTGCYNVSGEYAMVKAASAKGWIDERKTVLESLLGAKRAGAAFIATYWAKDCARWLKKA